MIQYENALLASSDSPQRCCRCIRSSLRLSRSRKLADQLHSSAVMLPWSPDFHKALQRFPVDSGWCQVLHVSTRLQVFIIFLYILVLFAREEEPFHQRVLALVSSCHLVRMADNVSSKEEALAFLRAQQPMVWAPHHGFERCWQTLFNLQ